MSPNTQIGVALLVFGALSVTMVIVGVRRRERTGGLGRVPPPDPDRTGPVSERAEEDYDLVIRGGARVNGVNVTWPYARLLVSRDQAELRVYALEPIVVARTEVTGLRWVYGPLGKGFAFRTGSGRLDRVIVWPLGRAKGPLNELGWR